MAIYSLPKTLHLASWPIWSTLGHRWNSNFRFSMHTVRTTDTVKQMKLSLNILIDFLVFNFKLYTVGPNIIELS